MRLIKHKKHWTYNADSMADIIGTVRQRIADYADGENGWNASSMTGDARFTGTESLDHAMDLFDNGRAEGARQILKGQADVAANGGLPDLTPSFDWDIGGEFPDVGAFCAGVPEHMANPAPFNNSVASVIRIAIPGSVPADVSADKIMRYGVALMSIVDGIQESGRSVALSWDLTCIPRDSPRGLEQIHTNIPLTTPGAPIDVSRLAFAFHPSMLRRIWFAAVEINPELSVLGGSYGGAQDARDKKHREPGTIYPPGPWALGRANKLGSISQAVEALTDAINRELFADQPRAD